MIFYAIFDMPAVRWCPEIGLCIKSSTKTICAGSGTCWLGCSATAAVRVTERKQLSKSAL